MRCLGFVAVGFGFVGIVIALVLVVGVWLAANRIVGATDRLTASADRGVTRASELLGRVSGRTTEIGIHVRAVVDELVESERKVLRPEDEPASRLARIATLEAASRESGAWSSWTEQASDRLRDVTETMGDLPFFIRSESGSGRRTRGSNGPSFGPVGGSGKRH